MADTLEYPYKTNIKKLALLLPVLAGLSWFMAHMAMTNDRGMLLFHVIELDVPGATRVLWGICAILGLGAVGGLIAIITQLNAGDATYLRIADDGFTIPVGFFEKRMEFVRYADVTKLTMMSVQGQNYLVIRHMGGKISLQQQAMADEESFLVAAGTIMANCPHLKDKT
jgi:hypothetical protein